MSEQHHQQSVDAAGLATAARTSAPLGALTSTPAAAAVPAPAPAAPLGIGALPQQLHAIPAVPQPVTAPLLPQQVLQQPQPAAPQPFYPEQLPADTLEPLHQQFLAAQQIFYSQDVQARLAAYDAVPGLKSALEMVACATGAFMAEQRARLRGTDLQFASAAAQPAAMPSDAPITAPNPAPAPPPQPQPGALPPPMVQPSAATPWASLDFMQQGSDGVSGSGDGDSGGGDGGDGGGGSRGVLWGGGGGKRKRVSGGGAGAGDELKLQAAPNAAVMSQLTNTNKCSVIDRALFTCVEATTGPLNTTLANYINTPEGRTLLEQETSRSHTQWVAVLSAGAGTVVPPNGLISASMLEANVEGVKLQETLAKRWGYLAKTARDVIRDIRGNEPMKLWWQQYEAALAEFGPRARELVEAGAAANWGIEDTDPYFDKDANSRNNPEAVMAARVMRRILAGAFAAQRCQPDDPPGLHRSVQYVLAAADSITDRLPPETIKDNAAARPDTLRKLWAALTAGFFQKAKIQVVNVIAGERELNSVAHALLYLSLDAAVRGCNMTERTHLTAHVKFLSSLYAATITAERTPRPPPAPLYHQIPLVPPHQPQLAQHAAFPPPTYAGLSAAPLLPSPLHHHHQQQAAAATAVNAAAAAAAAALANGGMSKAAKAQANAGGRGTEE